MNWIALIVIGALVWMCGLAALGVPANLPVWRHAAGGALIALAVHLLIKAASSTGN